MSFLQKGEQQADGLSLALQYPHSLPLPNMYFPRGRKHKGGLQKKHFCMLRLNMLSSSANVNTVAHVWGQ